MPKIASIPKIGRERNATVHAQAALAPRKIPQNLLLCSKERPFARRSSPERPPAAFFSFGKFGKLPFSGMKRHNRSHSQRGMNASRAKQTRTPSQKAPPCRTCSQTIPSSLPATASASMGPTLRSTTWTRARSATCPCSDARSRCADSRAGAASAASTSGRTNKARAR